MRDGAPASPRDDGGTEAFVAERDRLVGLAYRIIGSWAEAEDVAQDAWLRWSGLRPDERIAVRNPAAWLTTTASRLALDRLRSARHRREVYVGPWLPEPVVTAPWRPELVGTAADPQAHAELAESLTLGFLAVLEALTPVERVVFILADVYQLPFADVAQAVERSPEACRQIASRARQRLRDGRRRLDPPADAQRVLGDLLAAVAVGDVAGVASLLAGDVVVLSDGGSARHAARRPVVGPERSARFLVNLTRRYAEFFFEPATVNGQPGLVVRSGPGAPVDFVIEVEVVGGLVWRVNAVRAPDKLSHLGSPGG